MKKYSVLPLLLGLGVEFAQACPGYNVPQPGHGQGSYSRSYGGKSLARSQPYMSHHSGTNFDDPDIA
jgi:hypothetical protein